LLREGSPIGVIAMTRSTVSPFTEKQIELLRTFADQAVIAIENVRLFEAEQERTRELSDSLQQQTATADVLKVISRSTFDLRSVLQTLVESAARFCAADKATVVREKDGLFYAAEAYGYSREFLEYIRNTPVKAERGSASGRALVEGRAVHIGDVRADPEYTLVEAQRLGDYRTALCVPMLREGVPIGVLTLTRSEEVRSKLVLRNERHALSADYRMLFAGCHRLMGVVNAHQCTILVRRQCARDDGGGAIGVGLRAGVAARFGGGVGIFARISSSAACGLVIWPAI
jgi:GAF domain-containing protein